MTNPKSRKQSAEDKIRSTERRRIVAFLKAAAVELASRESERHDLSSERLLWAANRISRNHIELVQSKPQTGK